MAGGITSAIGDVGGAVNSLFAGFGAQARAGSFRTRAQGDILRGEGALIEASNYQRAEDLARTNEEYVKESTAIQQAQADREILLNRGKAVAAAGESGVTQGGSALDILAANASQGELQKQVLAKQGLITEAGYEEQAQSYGAMVNAANIAVQGEYEAYKGDLAAASSEDTTAKGSFIGAAIKGVAAVASIALAPATGGLSLGALAGNALIPGNWGEQS